MTGHDAEAETSAAISAETSADPRPGTRAARPAAPDPALTLTAGALLMLATGAVDAYVFLQHGHVFAEAMTGNLVLIAIGAVAPEVIAFWLPLVTYLAFAAGVAAAWVLSRSATEVTRTRRERTLQLLTLLLQVAVLTAVGFLPPTFPQPAVTCTVAFVSGMQIAGFRQVGDSAFTTTVMTSNSVRMINATLAALTGREAGRWRVPRSLLVPFAGFVAGVFVGAFSSAGLGDRAAWVCAALMLLVLLVHHRPRRVRSAVPAG
ncbi:uncharacterized membrane protein YoaK (UPF0700 family) [Friedmanniella endophytica]|uniref:Uncharacterized membrane protein YoaK (UPF0700 family) n=1 Tax=Microlunatus kandeliicorticis TaxID=1759536 RepID=A0A7W3ISQ2_9ACTN|nr:YoaK family protein [Microlunatus kandeliicorticis]MBA8794544.1 uncharacterized membrane protein YoaK (UPF0700 family) [Microlunatus kandeliicorticis]